MAIKIIPFGSSPTDKVIKRWLESQGISPKLVLSYTISRGTDKYDISTITLNLIYDESAIAAEDEKE